jgi:hypothetical protein
MSEFISFGHQTQSLFLWPSDSFHSSEFMIQAIRQFLQVRANFFGHLTVFTGHSLFLCPSDSFHRSEFIFLASDSFHRSEFISLAIRQFAFDPGHQTVFTGKSSLLRPEFSQVRAHSVSKHTVSLVKVHVSGHQTVF